MTDSLTEDLDQQLQKIQSAREQLQLTRQLLSESGSSELKGADSRLAEMIAALNAELEEVQRKKAQQQAAVLAGQRLQQLESELAQTRSQLTEQTHEVEQLLVQLHQVQEELESVYLKAQADKSAGEQQMAQLNEQLQHAQSATAAAEHKLAQQTEQLQRQLDEAQQENDLLLLQLHQVQEELEQHFLDKQKLQRECETLQQRWQRLERRLPGYCDYELIETVAVDAVSDQPRIDWRILNLSLAGQFHAELGFSTLLKDGQAGIVLDGIELFPRGLRGPDAANAVAQFRRFGSRQWDMVLAAATALEQFFAGKPAAAPQLSFDPVFWRQALLPLVAELRALPAVFRFDGVTLKRELVNPDYEHLWLVLEGASLGQQSWPKFELRLGAADIRRGRFSRHPKLEFPLIDGKTRPFDSWYEESHDDFGGKFELRFDLDRQLMDLGVWSRLSVDDRKLLLSINGVLGPALQRLQIDNCPISRGWSEWQGLVTGIIATLQKLSEIGAQQQKAKAQQQPATSTVKAAASKKASAKKAVAKKAPARQAPAVKKTATRKPVAR